MLLLSMSLTALIAGVMPHSGIVGAWPACHAVAVITGSGLLDHAVAASNCGRHQGLAEAVCISSA
jgi:hypothetical protein